MEALNLPVMATGLADHRPKRHGEGLVKLNEKKTIYSRDKSSCVFICNLQYGMVTRVAKKAEEMHRGSGMFPCIL